MAINRSILELNQKFTSWRLELHRHPELAFEESWTSDYITGKLESFEIPVYRGLVGIGVVATLSRSQGPSDRLRT